MPTNSRANAALTHPHFPSTCWASHSGCPPPVLTAAQVADIEGGDVGRCRSAVERLLVKVEESNLQVESALQVLTSGWLVPGKRECGQQTCPDCKVAPFINITTCFQLRGSYISRHGGIQGTRKSHAWQSALLQPD